MNLFVDTEFTDFVHMDLISVGIISEDGKHEFYAEISDFSRVECSDFVVEVVLPLLEGGACLAPYDVVSARLNAWLQNLGDDFQFVVDYSGDWTLVNELLRATRRDINKGLPKVVCAMLVPFFDFTCMERGIHMPNDVNRRKGVLVTAQEDYFNHADSRQHHSMVDAKALRSGWVLALK